MSYGVKRLRFKKKRKSYKPLAYIILFLSAIFGVWLGWNLMGSGRGQETAASSVPIAAPAPESLPVQSPESTAPSEIPVRKVLESVIGSWVKALVSEDFTAFHQSLSSSWQQKDSIEQLKRAYIVLTPYKDNLELFPSRGKLVLLESRPFDTTNENVAAAIKDNLGPQSPWLVRGEWRVGRTALGFTLILSFEAGQWRPSGLRVDIFA
jgi:hypothetical protein